MDVNGINLTPFDINTILYFYKTSNGIKSTSIFFRVARDDAN